MIAEESIKRIANKLTKRMAELNEKQKDYVKDTIVKKIKGIQKSTDMETNSYQEKLKELQKSPFTQELSQQDWFDAQSEASNSTLVEKIKKIIDNSETPDNIKINKNSFFEILEADKNNINAKKIIKFYDERLEKLWKTPFGQQFTPLEWYKAYETANAGDGENPTTYKGFANTVVTEIKKQLNSKNLYPKISYGSNGFIGVSLDTNNIENFKTFDGFKKIKNAIENVANKFDLSIEKPSYVTKNNEITITTRLLFTKGLNKEPVETIPAYKDDRQYLKDEEDVRDFTNLKNIVDRAANNIQGLKNAYSEVWQEHERLKHHSPSKEFLQKIFPPMREIIKLLSRDELKNLKKNAHAGKFISEMTGSKEGNEVIEFLIDKLGYDEAEIEKFVLAGSNIWHNMNEKKCYEIAEKSDIEAMKNAFRGQKAQTILNLIRKYVKDSGMEEAEIKQNKKLTSNLFYLMSLKEDTIEP